MLHAYSFTSICPTGVFSKTTVAQLRADTNAMLRQERGWETRAGDVVES